MHSSGGGSRRRVAFVRRRQRHLRVAGAASTDHSERQPQRAALTLQSGFGNHDPADASVARWAAITTSSDIHDTGETKKQVTNSHTHNHVTKNNHLNTHTGNNERERRNFKCMRTAAARRMAAGGKCSATSANGSNGHVQGGRQRARLQRGA